VEWLCDQHHGDAGVISSSKKMQKKNIISQERQQVTKKKIDSVLHHPVVSLKKVVRLPSKDRKSVIKELKQQVRKHRGSSVRNGLKVIEGG